MRASLDGSGEIPRRVCFFDAQDCNAVPASNKG